MAHPDSVSASEIKALLVARRGDWPRISHEAKVSYSWISKFVNGHIDNPGYHTLCELRDYLTRTPAATAPAAAAEPKVA